MTDHPKSPPPPRLRLEKVIDPDAITLLDFYAAAIVIGGVGHSNVDIFNKAAALVAESRTPERPHPMTATRALVARLVVLLALSVSACDYNLTFPSPTTTVTNTNANTNTTTVDIHDLVPLPPSGTPLPGGGNGTPDSTLPIPLGSEGIARSVAAAYPTLLNQSCQATDGADAWKFLDLLVGTLRVQDARWGYVCKDAACSTISQDTVGYRATADDIGTWVVDVIGNHCGLPALTPSFTWNVTGLEPGRTWKSSR